MSKDTYAKLHQHILQKEKPEDPLTLDPVAEDDILNKCKVISYMAIIDNKLVKIFYNTLDFMKGWFLDQGKTKFPQNNMIVPKVFLDRLSLQLKAQDFFGENHEPTNLSQKFSDFIYSPEKITPIILCELKNFLHMDDSGFLSTFVVGNPSELREAALKTITLAPNGSWLIRRASVNDSDVIKARVITYKNVSGEINNIIVTHIYSYGYCLPNCQRNITLPTIGEHLPSYIDDNKQIVNFLDGITFYPSFIDCIENMSRIYSFTKTLLIQSLIQSLIQDNIV
jgi:hypothetical protein